MDSEIDVELFIEEVKKYPELWDVSCSDYKDKVKKRNAWIEICSVFCEGFKEKEEKDKCDIGKFLLFY